MKKILSSAVSLCILLLLAGPLRADPFDNWTASQVSTNPPGQLGLQLRGLAYGNRRYVCVGQYASDDNGFVQTSDDGINWTMRSLHDYSILDLYDVIYGNGIFVAVGWNDYNGSNIYTSTNGINWTPHTTAMANVYAVSYGDDTFVAVGDGLGLNFEITSTNVYYSYDGTTWYGYDSGYTGTLYDLAYGNGRFIAVDASRHIYSVFQSRMTNSLAGSSVSFCNGRFFIPAGSGTNLVSADGLNWSPVTNNTAVEFRHVVAAGGMLVAVGPGIFTSPDGTNWTQRSLQASNVWLWDVASGDRNVVAAGQAYPSVPNIKPVAYVSDPFVALGVGSTFPPQLTVSGLTNRNYRVEMLADFSSTNWQTLTNLYLTNGPALWTDMQATNTSRFYRVKLLP